MIKLVVFDFDGTALPYGEKSVSDRIVNRIKDYASKGISFAVASGRTYSELKSLLLPLSDIIYFIADDGALTVKDDKIIYKKPFGFSSIKDFFDKDMVKGATFYSFDTAFTTKTNGTQNYGKKIKIAKRAFDVNEDIYKISADIKRSFIEKSGEYRVHFRENGFAEFVSPYSNKGIALVNLQLRLGLSRYETMAIGDAANDIPMMSQAHYSVSVLDKCPELVQKTKYNFDSIEKALDLLDDFLKQH